VLTTKSDDIVRTSNITKQDQVFFHNYGNREKNTGSRRRDCLKSTMRPKRKLMKMSFEIIEGQRFASRGKEPDIIGILDSDGRTFMIQRGRDGAWSIPYSHIAAWHSDADQDYAAENYAPDKIARDVGADSDLFGIAATSIDKVLSDRRQPKILIPNKSRERSRWPFNSHRCP